MGVPVASISTMKELAVSSADVSWPADTPADDSGPPLPSTPVMAPEKNAADRAATHAAPRYLPPQARAYAIQLGCTYVAISGSFSAASSAVKRWPSVPPPPPPLPLPLLPASALLLAAAAVKAEAPVP